MFNIRVEYALGATAKIINEEHKSLSYRLVNIFGQERLQAQSKDQEINIDLSDLLSDAYLLIVTDQDSKMSHTFKLIKI